jgi:CRP-like cAMP-binding protein
MDKLLALLNSIQPVSNRLQQHLLSILKTKEYPRKSILLKEGQVSITISFIEKGIVRGFYYKGETEISSGFMKEGYFILSVESFFDQKPSYENIQALEDTTVHYIDFTELQYIYNQFPEFNYTGRIITEKYYCMAEQRLYSLRMQKASDRYLYLLKNQPDLIQRVSSTYLASYLGITLETFSRMKTKTRII